MNNERPRCEHGYVYPEMYCPVCLTGLVQQLFEKIEELRAENQKLRDENQGLRKELDELKKSLTSARASALSVLQQAEQQRIDVATQESEVSDEG